MKLHGIARFPVALLLTIAACVPFTGCRSGAGGWKMPGSSLFASRDPDPATLAGTERSVPALPESPAAKYTPSSIAANSSQSSAADSAGAYGYGSTTTTSSATTSSAPKAGLAASANGYQTGPYQLGQAQVGPSPSTVSGSLASNASPVAGYPGATSSASASAATSLPSPYGGSYSGASSPSLPNVELPTSVTGALASSASVPTSSNNFAAPGVSGLPTYPSATAGGSPSSTTGNTMPSLPALSNMSATAGTGMSTPSSSMPGVSVGGTNSPVIPSSTAYQGATTLSNGTYSPGTTGRNTAYDFSGAAGSSPASSTSLPPNTATLPSLGPSTLLR